MGKYLTFKWKNMVDILWKRRYHCGKRWKNMENINIGIYCGERLLAHDIKKFLLSKSKKINIELMTKEEVVFEDFYNYEIIIKSCEENKLALMTMDSYTNLAEISTFEAVIGNNLWNEVKKAYYRERGELLEDGKFIVNSKLLGFWTVSAPWECSLLAFLMAKLLSSYYSKKVLYMNLAISNPGSYFFSKNYNENKDKSLERLLYYLMKDKSYPLEKLIFREKDFYSLWSEVQKKSYSMEGGEILVDSIDRFKSELNMDYIILDFGNNINEVNRKLMSITDVNLNIENFANSLTEDFLEVFMKKSMKVRFEEDRYRDGEGASALWEREGVYINPINEKDIKDFIQHKNNFSSIENDLGYLWEMIKQEIKHGDNAREVN